MDLQDLLPLLKPLEHQGPRALRLEGVTHDSRNVHPAFAFVALKGARQDGMQFLGQALDRGAVLVVAEEPCPVPRGVAFVRVADARAALARLSCALQGNPASYLEVIGITGTNGKTTTSYLCHAMLASDGRAPGLVGTVEYRMGERLIPASRTTPEAPELQSMLREMVRSGGHSVAMEVSSHSLCQHRVEGIDFDVAVFTNLTQDHLDYLGTMEAYFEAKAGLFRSLGRGEKKGRAVVNIDDPYGRRLAGMVGPNVDVVSYGFDPAALVRAESARLSAEGTDFRLVTPWGTAQVRLPLLGRFNVYNALAAVAACGSLGVPFAFLQHVLENAPAVPGRLERIACPRGAIFVDYAHTHHALENVLQTLRELQPRRLITVFGCGGDRDREKRPLMGRVARQLSDVTFLTSDNPRREDPLAILRQIEAGFEGRGGYTVEPDREAAIAAAIALLEDGDILLIAGKGHERMQEFATGQAPFDDRDVARRLIARLHRSH
ncbi:MAG: UDP-N-acetylmuramoyl-L-alanyl-D-glutamate--2,6-diaminopimelate ligase [Kiritimatiellia bacterium]